MVFYDGVKFACLSCIRGHRSSNCNHVDRPLLEVRKKGRPVSQCAYCRDLRKTKQIHAKCVCTTANNNNKNNQSSCRQEQQGECTCTEKTRVLLSSTKRRKTCSSSPLSTSPTITYSGTVGLTTASMAVAAGAATPTVTTLSSSSTATDTPQPPFLPSTEFDMLFAPSTLTQEMQQPTNEEDVATFFDNILQQQQQQSSGIISPSNGNSLNIPITTTTTTNSSLTCPTTVPSFCGSLIPQHTCLPQSLDAPAESVMVTITPLTINNTMLPCNNSNISNNNSSNNNSNNNNNNNNSDITKTSATTIRTRIVTCYCGETCTCPGCLVHHQNNIMFETSCPSSATSSCYNGSDDEQCHK